MSPPPQDRKIFATDLIDLPCKPLTHLPSRPLPLSPSRHHSSRDTPVLRRGLRPLGGGRGAEVAAAAPGRGRRTTASRWRSLPGGRRGGGMVVAVRQFGRFWGRRGLQSTDYHGLAVLRVFCDARLVLFSEGNGTPV